MKKNSWYQAILPLDAPLDRYYQIPGFLGSAEKEGAQILYFEKRPDIARRLKELKLAVLSEGDWQELWRDYFQPTPFAGFTVVPPWLENKGDLIINPGRGFGTGHHETTATVAELMRGVLGDTSLKTLLDVGTGSGILAIAAKKIRPDIAVTAIDNDPDAVENAAENLDHNGLAGKIRLSVTPLARFKKPYDIVVANIISGTLVQLSKELQKKSLRYLLLSGILQHEQGSFIPRMDLAGFRLINTGKRGEWVSFLFKREHGR
ncbi:MAG TPA: 50S ribosomal protein L11 methyltransferase [bacterium]|nr:50S ribosomal protein L11 methyltransferase [bacterium]